MFAQPVFAELSEFSPEASSFAFKPEDSNIPPVTGQNDFSSPSLTPSWVEPSISPVNPESDKPAPANNPIQQTDDFSSSSTFLTPSWTVPAVTPAHPETSEPSVNPIQQPEGFSSSSSFLNPSWTSPVVSPVIPGEDQPTPPSTEIEIPESPDSAFLTPAWVSPSVPQPPIDPQPEIQVESKPLIVHFIDVGQGDSIFIQTPVGKTILIDAGPTEAGSKVSSYLGSLGVQSLDLVIATHPHEDHIGGMVTVLNNFPVKQFIDSGYPQTTDTYENLLNLIDAKNIPYRTANIGDSITLDPSMSIQVISVQNSNDDDVNQNSIALRVTYKQTSFLLMGDAGNLIEENILNAGNVAHADVLKVGHHGSDDASGSAFLNAVSPYYSIIEVGAGNDYDLPSEAALDRLSGAGSIIYRTDVDGTVVVESDGMTLQITPAKQDTPVSPSQIATPVSPVVEPVNPEPESTHDISPVQPVNPVTPSIPVSPPAVLPASTIPQPAGGSPAPVCDCSSNVYNCGDFPLPNGASGQDCYDYCIAQGKGDIHRLDGDKDGLACEG